MKKSLLLALLMGLTGCAGLGSAPDRGGLVTVSGDARGAYGRYTIPRQVRYSFTLQNTTGQLLPKAEFWTYAPVRQTSAQHVDKITASQPYRLVVDDLGNEILHFELTNLPPYSAKVVAIQVDLYMSDSANPVTEKNTQQFVMPARYIESDDHRIAELAKKLVGKTTIDTAKRQFDWVAANVFSENYIPDDRGAVYALTHKEGDCTEFMYLFAALSRASGIPSRGMGGYVYSKNAVLSATDYHNWAEFYADGAWYIADAQKQVFMQKQSDYVAMRIISDFTPNPLGDSHRFSYAGEGLNVTMN